MLAPMRRLTPYLLLAVLVLGTGLGIALGLSEAPTNVYGWVAYAPLSSAPNFPQSTTQSSPTVTATPPTTTTVPYVAAAVRCRTSQLGLSAGAFVSPISGQHPLLMTLTNEGSSACYLLGYPGIALYNAQDQLLPITYRWAGDQEVTSAPPVRVGLAPGGTAYVLISKYRCDVGSEDPATTLSLTPPDEASALSLNIRGLMSEDYCEAPAQIAGTTLEISPVEPSADATFSFG
jgi:hypothetical protein